MSKALQYRRLFGVGLLVLAALAGLGYRLIDLQLVRHEELGAEAQRNTRRAITRVPLRGQIRDIRGNMLATSAPAKVVCADPRLLAVHRLEVARLLAPLLQTNETALAERLAPKVREDGRTNGYVVLKRKVSLETWQKVEQAMAAVGAGLEEKKLPKAERALLQVVRRKAVFAEEDEIRSYPNRRLAAHVLGYVNVNDETLAGVNGMELVMNGKLTGVQGWRRTELDHRMREVVPFRDQDVEPRDGMNVVLTLDAGLQNIVEAELAEAMQRHSPVSVSAVVMRPQTGEILAMATLPNFDPNHPGASPIDALRNRVISDVAEPGSTFKIVVVSAALNEGLVTLAEPFDCEHGHFTFAGRTLHDHGSYGVLSVEQIISKSSNIGAAKVGIVLGQARLQQYIRQFGFGFRTGIPLPGEVAGIFNPGGWTKVSIAQVPMGHGVAVTPLQMVMAMGALANRGVLMRPMLVDRLEDVEGRVVARYQPQAVRRVVSEKAAADMVVALRGVVTADGTALKAKLDNFSVAGKTGTAQKPGPGGYHAGKYFSSFIGFFPATRPELCISVVMDEPRQGYFGGQTAAPVFKGIAEKAANHLNIRPDIQPEKPSTETLASLPGQP